AAATSSAVQPYCVLHITDDEKRQTIADNCGPQQKVRDCAAFFIICGDLCKHMLIFEQAGKEYDPRLEAFMVATIDATLFAQNFTLALESLGYGTCYIGGLRNNLPTITDLLNLPKGVLPLYGLCVGVPNESPMHRPRLAPDAILFENTYPDDETTLASIDTYDEIYAEYLHARGAKPGTWSQSILTKFKAISRPGLSAYYQSQGARLD
ncbi:MAG: nitroreductase family protein, partial [Phycisphaerales bacterium]